MTQPNPPRPERARRRRDTDDDPTLPAVTRDEQAAEWGDTDERDAEWYRRERPPHHE